MGKFRVGDKVRIDKYLEGLQSNREKYDIVDEMVEYADKITTVAYVDDIDDESYFLEIDGEEWLWGENLLTNEFQIGDRIRSINKDVDFDMESVYNKLGTIVDIERYDINKLYVVEFDEYMNGFGHTDIEGYKLGKDGHCGMCSVHDMVKLCDNEEELNEDIINAIDKLKGDLTNKVYYGIEIVHMVQSGELTEGDHFYSISTDENNCVDYIVGSASNSPSLDTLVNEKFKVGQRVRYGELGDSIRNACEIGVGIRHMDWESGIYTKNVNSVLEFIIGSDESERKSLMNDKVWEVEKW